MIEIVSDAGANSPAGATTNMPRRQRGRAVYERGSPNSREYQQVTGLAYIAVHAPSSMALTHA